MDNQVYGVEAENRSSGKIPFGAFTVVQLSWLHHQADGFTGYTKEDERKEEGIGSVIHHQ